jgi:uncharacterized membrane-anchored protein YjiN (DUF445 family)
MTAHAARFSGAHWRRALATGLLGLMGAILVTTIYLPSPGFWLGLAQAGAEAALVGGLADWFAVTALFRRPLGLPIPHTAVVPSNKDRIGAGLSEFFEQNFLTRDTLAMALRSIDPAYRMAEWLMTSQNARTAAEHMLSEAPSLIDFIDAGMLRALVTTSVQERLLRVDLRPLLRAAAELFIAAKLHAKLLDDALDASRDFLQRKEARFNARVNARRRGFVRRSVDRGVSRAILDGLQELIDELSAPENASRATLLSLMEARTRAVVGSAENAFAVSGAIARYVAQPGAEARLAEILHDARNFAADNAPAASDARATLADLLRAMGGALLADAGLREKFNSALETAALQVSPLRQELTKRVADIVRKWDAQEFSDRIESAVENDLQFIRINGTVVGGIVGCLLHVAKAALE